MTVNDERLPILNFREQILAELARAGALILAAPTGSGKSTQVPQFLRSVTPGRILVLEPRRLSARSLAARIAAELGAALGDDVGYQVRFDSRCRPDTRIVFQTYGLFVQTLRDSPDLPGIDAVVLDEFHERTLQSDLSLAWLKTLRRKRPELKIIVMSATLDGGAIARYLPEAARLDIPGRLFPVDVRHSPLASREGLAEGSLRAVQELAREGLDGSILVFMPGLREIRRSLTVLGPYCRARDLGLLSIHGSMELADQQKALDPSAGRRVIVATNVAETGLTVPGVTMVVDSGQHRVAAFDPARGINTLYSVRISRANADQRTGRAGRTAPGRCVRLWSRADEGAMAPNQPPEISRLELSSLCLQASSLPGEISWLTPPRPEAWSAAKAGLAAIGALDGTGRITAAGRAFTRYPTPPRVASVLEAAAALGSAAFRRACAMAALFETSPDLSPAQGDDLAALADDLISAPRGEWPWETTETFRQLLRMADAQAPSRAAPSSDDLVKIWLDAFGDRLAAREGEGAFYRLRDGRGAVLLDSKNPPPLLLALDVRERAGDGRAKQVAVHLYLRLNPDHIERLYPKECSWAPVSEFDERKNRVVREERLMFRGVVLARRELAPTKSGRRAIADIWADKYASGEIVHPSYNEKAAQLVTRVRLARSLYPDLGYPAMDADDRRLIYGEAFTGRNSQKDIERAALLPHFESYLGPALKAHLDLVLPTQRRLPSGKSGRFTYFDPPRAELAARLGDFAGMTGALFLCEGRLPVAFDILAPNHRTVQKTGDLSSFWKNTYPTVKKELSRRYPKHPWP